MRCDSGFCGQRLIRWCERRGIGYVIGVARNARLLAHVAVWQQELEAAFVRDGTKQHVIREFRYTADSWDIERRVVTRLEYGAQGTNPRFVVTNLGLPAADLYDGLFCKRGEAENRIKEAQLDLFGTIRVKLPKIGAAVLRNTRRVRILLASHHPLRTVFLHAAGALSP